MVPNMLPRPRLISMRKNMTDQKGEAGKWVIASVKAMKAKPVPWTACWRTERYFKIWVLVDDCKTFPYLMRPIKITRFFTQMAFVVKHVKVSQSVLYPLFKITVVPHYFMV